MNLLEHLRQRFYKGNGEGTFSLKRLGASYLDTTIDARKGKSILHMASAYTVGVIALWLM